MLSFGLPVPVAESSSAPPLMNVFIKIQSLQLHSEGRGIQDEFAKIMGKIQQTAGRSSSRALTLPIRHLFAQKNPLRTQALNKKIAAIIFFCCFFFRENKKHICA